MNVVNANIEKTEVVLAEVEKLPTAEIEETIEINNKVTTFLGKQPLYNNMAEFDAMMKSDEPIRF